MKYMIFKITEDYATCINEDSETIDISLESIPPNSEEDDIISIEDSNINPTTEELKKYRQCKYRNMRIKNKSALS